MRVVRDELVEADVDLEDLEAGAGGTQFLTKELQPVPPVAQSEPSVPASHTQVGEPSAFVSVMVAWWCIRSWSTWWYR